MDIKHYHTIYFLGAGGIGMSALVRYFLKSKKRVLGYDKTPSPLTQMLEDEGAKLHYEENLELIQNENLTPDTTLVVYTPAVPTDHLEYRYFLKNNFVILKRAEALGIITKEYKNIAVAGSHGKTTTSSLLAHLLGQRKGGVNAFLGGVEKHSNTNFFYSNSSEWVVTEADEFDRSFLQLSPHIAIITSIDADHLDIYGEYEVLLQSFYDFADLVSSDGSLLINGKLKSDFQGRYSFKTYGLQADDDYRGEIVDERSGIFHFSTPKQRYENLQVGISGYYNIENTVAVLAALSEAGFDLPELIPFLKTFEGNFRRFDVQCRGEKLFVDDYAHHPKELKSLITAVKNMYVGKRVLGIFQPHLYTRTRDLADGFVEALSMLDEVVLLPIYPAREKPIEGITSEWLLAQLPKMPKVLAQKEMLIEILENRSFDIVLTIGAGDIDRLVMPLKNWMLNKFDCK